MSQLVQDVNGFCIIRQHEYTQYDAGYAVIDQHDKQVAWFADAENDEEGQDTALAEAVEWCKL